MSHLEFDPALVVVAGAHGDVVGGSLPLDLAHLLRVLERAPLQGEKSIKSAPSLDRNLKLCLFVGGGGSKLWLGGRALVL